MPEGGRIDLELGRKTGWSRRYAGAELFPRGRHEEPRVRGTYFVRRTASGSGSGSYVHPADHAESSFELMQGVLHATEHRLAKLHFDARSPVSTRWRRAGRIGPLALFRHAFSVMAELRDVAPTNKPVVCTTRGI